MMRVWLLLRTKAIPQAYAAHELDIVNHFKWRYKLQDKIWKSGAKTPAQKKKVLEKEWIDLDETTILRHYPSQRQTHFSQACQRLLIYFCRNHASPLQCLYRK